MRLNKLISGTQSSTLHTYWHSLRRGLASWFLNCQEFLFHGTKSHSPSSFEQKRKPTRMTYLCLILEVSLHCWDWKWLVFMRLPAAANGEQEVAVMKGLQRKQKAGEKQRVKAQIWCPTNGRLHYMTKSLGRLELECVFPASPASSAR